MSIPKSLEDCKELVRNMHEKYHADNRKPNLINLSEEEIKVLSDKGYTLWEIFLMSRIEFEEKTVEGKSYLIPKITLPF